jgi:hypothetical protein
MRFSLFSLSLLSLGVSALPAVGSGKEAAAALGKRQLLATNDEATGVRKYTSTYFQCFEDPEVLNHANAVLTFTQFASLNGGTTGGGSGPTTTVTTYEELVAAVAGDAAKTVIVSGTIEIEAEQVEVGSNTSLLGKDSGAILIGFGM